MQKIKETTMQVNDQLSGRRDKLNKIVTVTGIYLQVTLLATVINTVACCAEVEWLFIPYSLTCVHFSFEYGLFLIEQGRIALSACVLLFSVAVAVLFLIGCIKMRAESKWAGLISVIMWADLIITAAFAFTRLETVFYAVDIALHMFVVVQTMRARRASYGLSVLPEEEYEGDPFEEFKNN